MWQQNLVGYTWRFCKFTPHGKPDLQYTVSSVMYFHDFKKAHFCTFPVYRMPSCFHDWMITKDNWLLYHLVYILDFIPGREIRSISSRGPIEVSFHLLNFGVERVYRTSKTYMVYRVFFCVKMFYPPKGDTYYIQ